MSDTFDMTTGRGLTACPQCDALYRMQTVPGGTRVRCARCGFTLFAPRDGAVLTVVCLALAALFLMIVAIAAPFLRIEASGLSSSASVLDAIMAFARGSGSLLMIPLSAATAALIVLLPVTRTCALIYALAPLINGKPPLPYAALAFRLAMRLRPWAMAEIFMIGVAVALIKISGLAQVEFGAAFWAFGGLVILVAAKDAVLCERSIWQLLTTPARH